MSFNKIFILGAGAIGSVYGALLSKRNDVTLVGNKKHVETVNSKGLTITGDINETFHPRAETEIREIPEKTLIILTTKAYDSAAAVRGIKRLLREDTAVLVLQNGLGNEDVVRQVLGANTKVLRGITTMAAEFFEAGKIRFWNGETTVEKSEHSETIAKTFNQCGLKTKISDDIKRDVWNKLVVNCVINPLTAILKVRNNQIITDSLKPIRHEIIRECVEVGKAEGITFPDDLEEIMRRVADAESIPFQRVKKEVDIKKFLLRWAIVPREDEVVVRMLLKTGSNGSGRPMEYFLWAGFSLEDLADARFVRTEILIPAGEGFVNPLGEARDLGKFFGEEGK